MLKDNLVKIEECFRQARITGELSVSSVTKYRDSLNKFFAIVGDKSIADLDLKDFDGFILKMRDNGASNSRIANVISAVKWMVKRLQDENKISKALDLEKVRKPKIGKKEVLYFSEEDIKLFFEAIDNDNQKGRIRQYRARAFFFFLLSTGSRIGEALSVKIEDINRQNKEIQIVGKGNKPRTLFLKDELLVRIDQYLSLRKDKNKYLFVSLSGDSCWQQTDAGRSFRRYKNLSGVNNKFKIHTLRHTFASQYLMKGAGINVVQTALGHSDAVTTLKYYAGAVNKEKVREMINDEHFNFIPESALKIKESMRL